MKYFHTLECPKCKKKTRFSVTDKDTQIVFTCPFCFYENRMYAHQLISLIELKRIRFQQKCLLKKLKKQFKCGKEVMLKSNKDIVNEQ